MYASSPTFMFSDLFLTILNTDTIFFSLNIFIVPPDIINEDSSTDIAVQEGEDATLTCRATGHPPPRVVWRREDGEPILMRKPGTSGKELVKCKYFTIPSALFSSS